MFRTTPSWISGSDCTVSDYSVTNLRDRPIRLGRIRHESEGPIGTPRIIPSWIWGIDRNVSDYSVTRPRDRAERLGLFRHETVRFMGESSNTWNGILKRRYGNLPESTLTFGTIRHSPIQLKTTIVVPGECTTKLRNHLKLKYKRGNILTSETYNFSICLFLYFSRFFAQCLSKNTEFGNRKYLFMVIK